MKIGTVVRIVRFIAVIAVLVMLVYPAANAVSDLAQGSSTSIGIESEYDLSVMNANTLEMNINYCLEANPECVAHYGVVSEPVNQDNVSSVAARIMASGAETARITDPDGNVLRQQMLGYTTDVATHAMTALPLPPSIGGALDLVVKMVFSGADGDLVMTVPNEAVIEDDTMVVDVAIPYLVINMAAAAGFNQSVTIVAEYVGLVSFSVDMIYDESMTGVTVSKSGGSYVFSGDVVGQDGTASLGDTAVTISSGKMTVSADSGDALDAIRGSVADGCLTLSCEGDEYILDRDTTAAIIAILEGAA